MKKSQKDTKDSQWKVIDKQSLYRLLYAMLLFELPILAVAGLSWLVLRDLSCLWGILGIGQALIITNLILALREYSALQVVQKMKEKSPVAEARSGESVQIEGINQQGNSPEFKIHATYAIDSLKLSTDEQKFIAKLSRNLKLELILWSINISLLSLVFGFLAVYDWARTDPVFMIAFINFIMFIVLALSLSATYHDRFAAGRPADFSLFYLTVKEPRGLKVGLIVYIAFRAILLIQHEHPNIFLLTSIVIALAVNICVGLILYRLRWKVKKQGFSTVNMLALWVFGTRNIWDLLEHLILPIWRKLGNIYLIRGGEHILNRVSLWDSLLFLRGKDRIISKTPEQITQKLNEFQKKTNRSPEFQFNTLICGDNSWQFALHSLIDDADLVVMHLSSFSPSNQGCIYELDQLINRVPTENFFLLVDRHSTDYNFLLEKLQELWKKMKSSSPNRKEQSQGIQIIFLDHSVKTPEEVEVIYKEMNSAQQNALDVLADDPHKKELVTQHETKYRQEMEGLFRALFARAIQLRIG